MAAESCRRCSTRSLNWSAGSRKRWRPPSVRRLPRSFRTAVAALFLMTVASPTTTVHAAGEYRTFDVESLRVTLDSEWPSPTAAGYLPVRFDITNLGEDRLIEIVGNGTRVIRSGRAGYAQGNFSVRRSIRLSRGARVRFTMPVPTGGQNEHMR